jgi:outer membrane lipoprotein SlyB
MNQNLLLRTLAITTLATWLAACAPETPQDEAADPAAEETAEPSPEPTAEPTPEPTAAPVAASKPRPVAPAQPQPTVCADCGTVVAITPVQVKGEGSGAGAVAGAVAGGVAGHQFGSGRGNDAATAAGAILGAIAGHQVEKRVRSTTVYDITVGMETGGQRVVRVIDAAGVSVGTRVIVEGENIRLR